MADFTSLMLGWREFKSREEIAEYVAHSVNFDPTLEDPRTTKTLLLFQTSRQRTWLAATPERLYCILDDVRKPEPHINWSMPRAKIIENGEVGLEIRPHDRTARTGLVDFGDEHRRWLYTRDLFDRGDVVAATREFLKQAMPQRPE
jgi:hypothetical protein